MEQFAKQCTANLRIWETRSSELIATALVTPLKEPHPPVSPSRLPENFFNAFPMTIPTHLVTPEEQAEAFGTWHHAEASSSSGASSEHSYPRSETQSINLQTISQLPSASASPLLPPPESPESCLLSPREPSVPSYQRPSSAGSSSSIASDATTSIRAAYHAGVRKKRSMNRNSWNMSTRVSSPPPPSPQVPKVGFMNFVIKDSSMHHSTLSESTDLNSPIAIAHSAPSPTSSTTSIGGGGL
jgi:hypothetical protein